MGASFTKEDEEHASESDEAFNARASLKRVRKSIQSSKSLLYFKRSSTEKSDSDCASEPHSLQMITAKDIEQNCADLKQTDASSIKGNHPSSVNIETSDNIIYSQIDVEGNNKEKETTNMAATVNKTENTGAESDNTKEVENYLNSEVPCQNESEDDNKIPSNSIDTIGESSSSTSDERKSKKKDSRKWNLKKKASIDLDWSVFKFASGESSYGTSRKQSVDCDDESPSTLPPRASKGSFDLGKVALRFTKRSSADRGFEASPLEEEPPPAQLSEDQKTIIKETWKTIEDSVAKVGVIMFIK